MQPLLLRVLKAGWVVLVVGLALPMHAAAQADSTNNGSKMLEQCTATLKPFGDRYIKETVGAEDCLAYVQGVWETLNSVGLECSPDEVTLGQAVRVVLKFLTDHPERLHEHKFVLVREALMRAWPCKRKPGGG